MKFLAELVPLALLAVPVGYAGWRLRERRTVARGRWRVVSRARREGGYVVELQCPGEPTQVVARIDADTDSEELSDAMADALAEAEARAATLNDARRATRR